LSEFQILRRGMAGGPLLTIKIPKLKATPFVDLPITSGPLGLVRFRRADIGEITPVNIEPIKSARMR